MSQYFMQAWDFIEPDTISKRLSVRPSHIERMKKEKEQGIFVYGGALLNEEGNMIGSVILLNLPNEKAVHDWIAEDPYFLNDVWDEIVVHPFRLADI